MKKIVFVLIALFAFQFAFSQKKKEKWHPFSNVPDLLFYLELNGFGQQIAEEDALGLGFKGAVTWNAKNAIGFTYGNTINKFTPSFEKDTSVYLKNALTGMYFERTFMPSKRVHITVPLAVGVGNSYYDWKELDAQGVASLPYKEEQYYLYLEPAIKLGVKLSDKFRLNAGVTYALAPMDFSYRGVTNENLSGLRFQAGIRFGKWWAAK
jgi:hypothetical protein